MRRHIPVLLIECVDLLAPAVDHADAVLVDATLGLGGHAEAFLATFPKLRLIGLDRDEAAIEAARARLAPFGDRFEAVHCTYDQILDVLADRDLPGVDAVLADLGVSSMQLDEVARGFSYSADAPLDMRMDQTTGLTAAEILATYDRADLTRVLREWGEERYAKRIADRIVAVREQTPLTRTSQLVDLIAEVMPAGQVGGHPAKRTFQALRIEVNSELEVLQRALPRAVEALVVGGRIAVLAYHSLEDRLVKTELARGATSSAPPELPIEPETHRPYLRLLTRRAVKASEAEIAVNPRAKSVRLRGAERIRPTPPHMRRQAA